MKTSELTGPALDWAVAKCVGQPDEWMADHRRGYINSASTDWAQGGPIIEQFEIDLKLVEEGLWQASRVFDDLEFHYYTGPTALVAAMRCFVASQLGDTVDW